MRYFKKIIYDGKRTFSLKKVNDERNLIKKV